MNDKRRMFLRGTLAASAVGLAAGAGLLAPGRALAAAWPKAAFEADSMDQALSETVGSTDLTESGEIKIKAPEIAENGAVVPVSVESALSDVESITIVVKDNPAPLSASFQLSGGTHPYVATRLKMGQTSDVYAVVKSGGQLYSAKQEVKVTIGGCGG